MFLLPHHNHCPISQHGGKAWQRFCKWAISSLWVAVPDLTSLDDSAYFAVAVGCHWLLVGSIHIETDQGEVFCYQFGHCSYLKTGEGCLMSADHCCGGFLDLLSCCLAHNVPASKCSYICFFCLGTNESGVPGLANSYSDALHYRKKFYACGSFEPHCAFK